MCTSFLEEKASARDEKWLKLLINIEKHLWRHALRNQLINYNCCHAVATHLCRVPDSIQL